MRVIDLENINNAMRNETQFVLRCEEVYHDKISAAAASILSTRQERPVVALTGPSEEVVQPLAGMLYCADCGRAMCRRSVKRGNRMFYYYVCSTHKRSKLCSSHSISQTALEDVVLRAI